MRNVKLRPVADKSIFDQPMTLLTADAKAAGRHRRHRARLLVVEHTTDNNL